MFNKIKPFVLGALCLAFISSCKKDVANDTAAEATTEKVNVEALASYYPNSNGSEYTYVDSTIDGAVTTARSIVSISGDTTIDGTSFSKSSSASAASYSNYSAGQTRLISFRGKDKLTTTPLKENEPVGTIWKDEFTNAGIPTTYEWKIVSKSLDRTVQGVTYNNVIQVHLDGSANVPGKGKVAFANSDYYYAPNVGLIENISYNPATGKTDLHRVLQKSIVK